MGMWNWFRRRPSEPTAAELLDQVTPSAATSSPVPVASAIVAGPPVAAGTATVVGPAVFAVIDVETTGLAAARDRVVELSVVRCDASGRPVDEWTSRFNPQGPVGATHIHGITAADVRDAPLFASSIPTITARLSGLVLVAHNARFDLAFLRSEFSRAGWVMPWAPTLCTLEESRWHLPSLSRRRLPDCCDAVGVRLQGAHSALGDARAAAGLLAAYLAPRRDVPNRYEPLMRDAIGLVWPDAPTGTSLAAPRPEVRPETRRIRAVAREHRRLVQLLDELDVAAAVPDGAPEGTASYLELLAEVFEDGVLTDDEVAALADVSALYELTPEVLASAHEAFLHALADEAVEDARVSQVERAELYEVAELLGVERTDVPAVLAAAAQRRDARRSEGLPPLPAGWPHGEPVRVGQSVVFTGCDEAVRTALEARTKDVGVRVGGTVSRSTSMLVTDGSFAGTKLDAAQRYGIRIVAPEVFSILLDYVQPALARQVATRKHGGMTPDSPARPAPTEAAPAAVREWARAQGIEVGARGRVPQSVVDQFEAAHRDRD